MRPRDYGEVVAALMRLGCKKVVESDDHITLCRFPKIVPVVRADPISIPQQLRILGQFGIGVDEYLEALDGVN